MIEGGEDLPDPSTGFNLQEILDAQTTTDFLAGFGTCVVSPRLELGPEIVRERAWFTPSTVKLVEPLKLTRKRIDFKTLKKQPTLRDVLM